MKNTTINLVGLFILILLFPGLGLCLTDSDIIALKKNGIGDDTLALMIQEKTIATAALTVQEIITLKRGGVSEKTLQMLIRETSGSQRPKTIVYGRDIQKRRFPTVDEIITLKNAGVSDEVVNTLIVNSPSETDRTDRDRERAWQMLDRMMLRVDKR